MNKKPKRFLVFVNTFINIKRIVNSVKILKYEFSPSG